MIHLDSCLYSCRELLLVVTSLPFQSRVVTVHWWRVTEERWSYVSSEMAVVFWIICLEPSFWRLSGVFRCLRIYYYFCSSSTFRRLKFCIQMSEPVKWCSSGFILKCISLRSSCNFVDESLQCFSHRLVTTVVCLALNSYL